MLFFQCVGHVLLSSVQSGAAQGPFRKVALVLKDCRTSRIDISMSTAKYQSSTKAVFSGTIPLKRFPGFRSPSGIEFAAYARCCATENTAHEDGDLGKLSSR